MQSPFYHSSRTVMRASRILTAVFVLFVVSAHSALAVGWQTGELQARVIEPGKEIIVLAQQTWDQIQEDDNSDLAQEPDTQQRRIEFEVNGNATTTVTTNWNGRTTTHTTITDWSNDENDQEQNPPASNQNNANFSTSLDDTDYSPPDWFVESSKKSQEEFDANQQKAHQDFENFNTSAKQDFDSFKAESQAKTDAWKTENGF